MLRVSRLWTEGTLPEIGHAALGVEVCVLGVQLERVDGLIPGHLGAGRGSIVILCRASLDGRQSQQRQNEGEKSGHGNDSFVVLSTKVSCWRWYLELFPSNLGHCEAYILTSPSTNLSFNTYKCRGLYGYKIRSTSAHVISFSSRCYGWDRRGPASMVCPGTAVQVDSCARGVRMETSRMLFQPDGSKEHPTGANFC